MRIAEESRQTLETKINMKINLDGLGENQIETPSGFFNHMLTIFSHHSLCDLTLHATGDIEVDYHHLVEDCGIVLGNVFLKAIGNKKGIKRYGSFFVPMDEALGFCSVDISGRPYFFYKGNFTSEKIGDFDVELVEEFFRAFAFNAKVTLHLELIRGGNAHHIAEALFKAFARAIREAISFDEREKGIPSTKGLL